MATASPPTTKTQIGNDGAWHEVVGPIEDDEQRHGYRRRRLLAMRIINENIGARTVQVEVWDGAAQVVLIVPATGLLQHDVLILAEEEGDEVVLAPDESIRVTTTGAIGADLHVHATYEDT